MARAAIAEDLFTMSDQPTLVGARCTACGAYTFPQRAGCPRCGRTEMAREELGDRGTLWAWTSQGFLPKEPFNGEFVSADDFRPWFVGVVEIAGKVRVESLLTAVAEEDLRIGMPLRLVLMPFRTDHETGDEIVTFAFAPEESHDD